MNCDGCVFWRLLSGADTKACHYCAMMETTRARGERGECLSRVTDIQVARAARDRMRRKGLDAEAAGQTKRGGIYYAG